MDREFVSQQEVERNTETSREYNYPDVHRWSATHGLTPPGTGQRFPAIPTADEEKQTLLNRRNAAAQAQVLSPARNGDLQLPILSDAKRKALLLSSLAVGGLGLFLYCFLTGKPLIQ
jgi:hypothetical protein